MAANDYQCDTCHIGTRIPRRTTVTYWIEGHLVIMPNVPVWVCDICGDVEFEMESVERLEVLLGIEPTLSNTDTTLGSPYGADDLTTLIFSRRRSV